MGAVLDRDDLIKQLAAMLNTLPALELPHSDLVVPAIGLDTATMISYGKVNVPSNTATYGFAQADHIHVSPDEAIDYGSVCHPPHRRSRRTRRTSHRRPSDRHRPTLTTY